MSITLNVYHVKITSHDSLYLYKLQSHCNKVIVAVLHAKATYKTVVPQC